MGAYLTYALDENGDLVHVDDVTKGLACKCCCPHCGAPLYAKNRGLIREHHFAHAQGRECEGAYETALHLLAKEVLLDVGQIMLPKTDNDSFPSGLVAIHNIKAEKWDEQYHIKPDVEGVLNNGERLLIEFLVSHKVDGKKRQTIVNNHLKCVEIDINYQSLDKAELRDFLILSSDDRKWVVSMPKPTLNDSHSNFYKRNPLFDIIRDLLKKQFDDETIQIRPIREYLYHHDRIYDLKTYGYDVCEVDTKYRGFKSDLLLYRSQKEDKGYISINIRGRRRSENFKYPKGLRIIDVVVKYGVSIDDIKTSLKGGCLLGDYRVDVCYYGFHNPYQDKRTVAEAMGVQKGYLEKKKQAYYNSQISKKMYL